VKAQIDGIRVTGLPDTIDVMIIGQGIVKISKIVILSMGSVV